MTPDKSDWHWSNAGPHLQGLTLYRRRWTMTRPQWDHDHCELCGSKFMAQDRAIPDTLHEGYATDDEYSWVCAQCFADFRDHYRWSVGA